MKTVTIVKWCAVGATMALAGCGSSGTSDQTSNGAAPQTAPASGGAKLTGAGSTFVYPIMSKWNDAYNKAKSVEINYQSIGSGGGIKALTENTVDFGASDAPLGDADLKKIKGDIAQIPVISGAEAIVYNLPNVPTGLKLGPDELASIYLGKITKWNDPKLMALNPGMKLPPTAIAVAHRSDGSGTTYIFTDYLSTANPDWKAKVGKGKSVAWPAGIGGKGNEGVSGLVKQTPGGIGYVELAYAMQNKLAYAAIRNKDGQFVEPSVDGTTAAATGAAAALKKDIRSSIVNAGGAKSYPICGFTYVLLYKQQKDSAKGKALTDFLKWALADGQSMAKDLYYAPLSPDVVQLNQATIDTVK